MTTGTKEWKAGGVNWLVGATRGIRFVAYDTWMDVCDAAADRTGEDDSGRRRGGRGSEWAGSNRSGAVTLRSTVELMLQWRRSAVDIRNRQPAGPVWKAAVANM